MTRTVLADLNPAAEPAGRTWHRRHERVAGRPDGVRVERILVQRHLDRPPREMLRVRRGRCLVADCATVAEVAQLVDLATLVPEQRAKAL